MEKERGLGLSIVFGIAKQNGGGLSVESEVGRGTTFNVYFRHATITLKPAAPNPRRTSIAPGRETILIVEDDDGLRTVMGKILTLAGYSVLLASSGAAALGLLGKQEGPVDLLLTDLVMPGMDGRSLARRVLESRPETAVLFVSGYTDHPTLKGAALGPGDHFLPKPFTPQELARAVRRALENADEDGHTVANSGAFVARAVR